VLTVYNKKEDGKFTEDDQRLLGILAAQSAQVIENARLYESEQAFQSMKEQLRLAAQIQLDLLPKSEPKVPGYDISGKTTPAQMVGGDYFDFLQLDEHRLAICLGDVSGKGLPASLLMANLQATLRGQALLGVSPKVCVQRSNKLLYLSTSSDKFATLFYGLLDSETHQFSYCNAGHENPFVFSKSPEPQRLDAGGVVLSILEEFPYEEGSIQLEPGDVIVIYSDGINEAININHEQYGIERLETLIRDHREDPASVLIGHIMQAVHKHSTNQPQTDDMTVVVIKRDR
jgi:sigma-B regulation protein RsbU (phosphoserine phosphatase)